MRKTYGFRKIALLLAMVMVIFTALSNNTIALAKSNKKVTKVTTTTPDTLTMKIGETYRIKTKVLPSNASNKKLTYKTSDSDIVKVSSKGKLTALDAGNATVTVKAVNGSGANAKCNFKVVVIESLKTAQFTTKDNYHSLMYVDIELPDAVSASDITSIGFSVNTKSALALRLYAGNDTVAKSDHSELTYEEKKILDTVAGKEEITENNTKVSKTKHDLTESIIKSSRIAVAAGDKEKVTFKVDDHAKKVLSSISGSVLTLGIYAHNTVPSYSVSSIQITTASKTYDIQLTDSNVGGLSGGSVTLVDAE